MFSPRSSRPALDLGWGRLAQSGVEPFTNGWGEALKHVGHSRVILKFAHKDKNMCANNEGFSKVRPGCHPERVQIACQNSTTT